MRRIKKKAENARVVTIKQWQKDLAHLDELIRPVVLKINDVHGLVTIRPKTAQEIHEIKVRRGLPLTDEELVMTPGSLLDRAARLGTL